MESPYPIEDGEPMTAQPQYNAPGLPEPLAGLVDLALDLRWSWSHSSDALWQELAPELWEVTRNPWYILQSMSRSRLEEVATDRDFVRLLERHLETRVEALTRPTWFETNYPESADPGSESSLGLVAYLCMEFGLSEALPIYSGGLGILAGDFLKTASDLGVPLVGVGLLWQQGYFRQALSLTGEQLEFYPVNVPNQLPITPLRNSKGDWITVEVEMPRRSVHLRAWEVHTGRTRLYLLDANDLMNSPADRGITSELYGGGPEMRLQQEMVLGIGGWRLLRRLGLKPTVCHLNEGHAALAVLERARSFMEDHAVDFHTALTATRPGNLFTTHTPVEAGFDRFPPELVTEYLGQYAAQLGITIEELILLGRPPSGLETEAWVEAGAGHCRAKDSEYFNMAYLALRGSGAVNGVSRLHAEVSRQLFQGLFPRWPRLEVPVGHVTNGVHVPSWDSEPADSLWTTHCGKDRWLSCSLGLEEAIRQISDEELWAFRDAARRRLIAVAREHARRQGPVAGSLEALGNDLSCLCDPALLTLGFARRFTSYKRPDLLLHDPDRLERILCQPEARAQLVLAGKAHPADSAGKAAIKRWTEFIARCMARPHIIFLVDYDMDAAEHLVQGVDLWINTPRRPWEACGTSGMKVLVNGGLNLSELDGWWAEAYSPDVGWAIGDRQEHDSDPAWDAAEAQQLYDILENEIIPEFYDRDEKGIPRRWIARVRASMARLTPQFSTNRMMKEYLENYYLSGSQAYRKRAAAVESHQAALAAELVSWRKLLDDHWDKIRFVELQVGTVVEDGKELHVFEAKLDLGAIPVEAVLVELYADPLNPQSGAPPERHAMIAVSGAPDRRQDKSPVYTLRASVPANRPASHYTPRVIPWHQSAIVPLEATQILWYR